MPVTYTVDSQRRLLEVTYSGAITKAEILAHWRALEADRRVDPSYDALIDLSAVTALPSPAETRELAAYVRHLGDPPSRLAVVATTDVVFGTMRMFEMLAQLGPPRHRVFRSAE